MERRFSEIRNRMPKRCQATARQDAEYRNDPERDAEAEEDHTMPDWPNAPPHRLLEPGTFMVTGATYLKRRWFDSPPKLDIVHDLLLGALKKAGWRVQAWAVFPNHYHVVAHSTDTPWDLPALLSRVHSVSATELNRKDNQPGRRVWYQFWDKALTYPKSYFPRLKYVHHNPVHHGLVRSAREYPWCSASWFEQRARPSFRKMVAGFKTDKLRVSDDYTAELGSWRWSL